MEKLYGLYKEFTSFEGRLFKYALSFSFLLALAPSVLVFALLFQFAYLNEDILLDFIIRFLPESDMATLNMIVQFFTNQEYSILSFIATIVSSFYLASRSLFSFMLISASREDIHVAKWAIRLKSMFLFILLAILLVFSLYIATTVLEYLPIMAAFIMFIILYMMYRMLSFRKRKASFGVIGALFSTGCIMALAALFVTIVEEFTSYQDVYGPLASLVTLLLAIYLISCIIYFGFCLNLVCDDAYGKEITLALRNEKWYMFVDTITDYIKQLYQKVKR